MKARLVAALSPGVERRQEDRRTATARGWSVRLASACMLVAACEEKPPIVIEGRRVAVAPYFDAPVCAGSVASFDSMVETIESETRLTAPRLTTFYWGGDAVTANCGGNSGALSCASVGKPEIFGYRSLLRHELAHAAGGKNGPAVPVVEEGFAISNGDICVSLSNFEDRLHSIREYADVSTTDIHRSGGSVVAGHFAVYLARSHGAVAWREFKDRSPPGTNAEELGDAFESAYGVPLDEAERDWFTEAPRKVCPPVREPIIMWTGAPLTFTHDLDCDRADTLGPFDRTIAAFPSFDETDILEAMYAQHWITLPFVDTWRVELEGPEGAAALLFARDCVDLPRSTEPIPTEYELAVGETSRLVMHACTYLLVIAAPPDAPAKVEIRITRVEDSP